MISRFFLSPFLCRIHDVRHKIRKKIEIITTATIQLNSSQSTLLIVTSLNGNEKTETVMMCCCDDAMPALVFQCFVAQ